MSIASAVYILASVVCCLSAVLLLRGYRRGGHRLLLWSGISLFGLALSNLLVFVDLVMLPNTDLYMARLVVAAISMLLLLYGLVWEGE